MNAIPTVDMAEVTRLTRAGRLAEATALLQGHLPSPAAPVPGPAFADNSPFAEMMRAFGIESPGQAASLGQAARQASVPDETGSGARFEERSYANAAGSRAYKLFIPAGFHGQPLPLVVMLHGCNQTPDDFASGTRMNILAQEQMFLVAYPAQSQAANPQRCWNWFSVADQARDRGEPSLIAGITRDIIRDMNADASRIYIAGLSAGGAAAATMAQAYSDLYAAVCVHSGLACGAATDMVSAFGAMQNGGATRPALSRVPAVPTMVFHGDRDSTVHAVNGDQVMAQAKGAGSWHTTVTRGDAASGQQFTRIVQFDEEGTPVHEQWVLHGGGHAWSGGSAAGSFTDPRGVDASREMLRFFWEHAKA